MLRDRHRPLAPDPRRGRARGPAAHVPVPQPPPRAPHRRPERPVRRAGGPHRGQGRRGGRGRGLRAGGGDRAGPDSLVLESREAVFVPDASGATTELCAIVRRDRLHPLAAEEALRMQSEALAAGRHARLMANPCSGRAALVVSAPARMRDDGGVEERARLVRPALRDTMVGEALAASNWQETGPSHWRALWEAELKALPTHTESRLWLVSGLLLPLWDRLPADSVQVRTLATDAGERLIGRMLGAAQGRRFALPWGSAAASPSPRGRCTRPSSTAARPSRSLTAVALRASARWARSASRSRGRPTPTCRRSNASAAPPKSSRGAPACSCPGRRCSTAGRSGRARMRPESPPLPVPPARARRTAGRPLVFLLFPQSGRVKDSFDTAYERAVYLA